MKISRNQFSAAYLTQILLYLFVNILFILKYLPRTGTVSAFLWILYAILVPAGLYLFKNQSYKIPERIYKVAFLTLLGIMILLIITLLIKIDPYSVRVDRWSAVSFFLDGLFNGVYPYGIHTHVSDTNFPSPFPVWHFINIPFYLSGDVGIGLIFFLLLTAVTVQYFFSSYRKSFLFLLLLSISPAYWWEVAVRSDSLSNALLVFVFILWWIKSEKKLGHHFLLAIIACGLLASTRLSAIIPIALFLFKPYLKLNWKKKIIFPAGILAVAVLTFLPFILWDTTNWVFFTRNPFMSQTGIGNSYILGGLVILGIITGSTWKSVDQYFFAASTFIFTFILVSQLGLIATKGVKGSVLSDSLYDISYFSLILPYALFFISEKTTKAPLN